MDSMSTPSPLKKLTRLPNALCKPPSASPRALPAALWHHILLNGTAMAQGHRRKIQSETSPSWGWWQFLRSEGIHENGAQHTASSKTTGPGKVCACFSACSRWVLLQGTFHGNTSSKGVSKVGKGQSFQPVVLGQLDNHTRKNEAGPLPYTIYKN